jgi:hypothetical protein
VHHPARLHLHLLHPEGEPTVTPSEKATERLAERIAALNRADAAMHAAMQTPTDDDDPKDKDSK